MQLHENGIFLLKASFRPIDDNDHSHHHHDRWNRCNGNDGMKAVIEAEEIMVKEKKPEKVREYEVLVTVEDGKLSLTGT